MTVVPTADRQETLWRDFTGQCPLAMFFEACLMLKHRNQSSLAPLWLIFIAQQNQLAKQLLAPEDEHDQLHCEHCNLRKRALAQQI